MRTSETHMSFAAEGCDVSKNNDKYGGTSL